jgi:Winged helix-turn helix
LAKRLQEPNHGFSSYGKVQQWLAERLGIEAEYHAVYQMTRYRLKAKLKVARPQNCQQDSEQREAFKQTSKANLDLLRQYDRQGRQVERPIGYFAQDESRFGLHTIIGRLITACGVKPIGQWQWLFKAFWL